MENFATFTEPQKQNRALKIQNSATEQTGFIASRFNKDNFWNLMFALMFFIGLASEFIVPQPFGGIIFLLATIGVVILVKYNSHLTFDKEKLEFTIGNGSKIQKAGVAFIWLLLISSFLAVLAAGLLAEGANINESLFRQFLTMLFLTFFPSLYCILRNFPIAVYFHKNAWYIDGANAYSSSSDHSKHSKPLLSLSRLRNSPINSWHSTNIYRRK